MQWINILIIFTQLFETLLLGRQLHASCTPTGRAHPAWRLRLSGRSPVTGPGRGRGSRPCGMTSTTRGAAGVAGPFKRFWGKLSTYHLCHEPSLYSSDFSYNVWKCLSHSCLLNWINEKEVILLSIIVIIVHLEAIKHLVLSENLSTRYQSCLNCPGMARTCTRPSHVAACSARETATEAKEITSAPAVARWWWETWRSKPLETVNESKQICNKTSTLSMQLYLKQ